MAKKIKTDVSGQPLPPQPTDRTYDQHRIALKKKVRIFYDLQRMRLQVSGRLYKRPEGVTIDLHEYDLKVLENRANDLHKAEVAALGDVKDHLKTIGFYKDVLSDKSVYKGVGPTMAGVILSEFNIYKEDTPSKCWSFAGLAPIPAKRCKQCHIVLDERELGGIYHPSKSECPLKGQLQPVGMSYDSGKTMRPTKGEKLPYNAFLKTKLVGVLGSVLLQLKSPWASMYYSYKARKVSAGWGRSDAHRHQAAIRYMIKMLLLKIWQDWRTYEKLPVRPSYQEEKLGHVHSGSQLGVFPPKLDIPEAHTLSPEEIAEIAAEVERAEA